MIEGQTRERNDCVVRSFRRRPTGSAWDRLDRFDRLGRIKLLDGSRRLASTTVASRCLPKPRRALNQRMTIRYRGMTWKYLRLTSGSVVGPHLWKFGTPTIRRNRLASASD